MLRLFRNTSLVIMLLPVVLISAGCTPRHHVPPAATPVKPKTDVGPYYFYTQSNLMKKRGDIPKAIEFLRQAVTRDEGSVFLKNELARLYIQHNDYSQALRVMQEILSKNPEDVQSVLMMASIYSTLNRHAEAIAAFEKALALDPESQRTYLLLGSEYVKDKVPEKALALYRKLTKKFPDSFPGFFQMGAVAAYLKDYPLAEKAFLKCLEIKPGYEQALLELVNLYEAMENDKKVIETYQEILANNPGNIRAAVGLGQYYLKMGRTAEAEKIFEELKFRSGSNPLVIKQIALIYLDQKAYKQAVETLKNLLESGSGNGELNYFLGMALEGLGKNDEAIVAYEKVTQTSSYFDSALVHLSFLYQSKGDNEKAVQLMKTSLNNAPNKPGGYLFLGALYEEMKLYDRAVETLQKGIALAPEHPRLHFRLGVVYDKAGDKPGCIEEMKKVITIDPGHAEALNYLGYTYAELGENLEEAERLIKKAMELKPDDGYITDSLGWVYFQKKLFHRAVNILEKALALVPDDPTILEHLGDAYTKTDEPTKALKFYHRALEHADAESKATLKRKIEKVEKSLENGH